MIGCVQTFSKLWRSRWREQNSLTLAHTLSHSHTHTHTLSLVLSVSLSHPPHLHFFFFFYNCIFSNAYSLLSFAAYVCVCLSISLTLSLSFATCLLLMCVTCACVWLYVQSIAFYGQFLFLCLCLCLTICEVIWRLYDFLVCGCVLSSSQLIHLDGFSLLVSMFNCKCVDVIFVFPFSSFLCSIHFSCLVSQSLLGSFFSKLLFYLFISSQYF